MTGCFASTTRTGSSSMSTRIASPSARSLGKWRGNRDGRLLAAASRRTGTVGEWHAPQTPVARLTRQIVALPHRLLAYQGADGHPVILPVAVTGHDEAGLRLAASSELLPPGGRRAGLLAHGFPPRCVGVSMRTVTGWLTVEDGRALCAPHTSTGMTAPPNRLVTTVAHGLLAKHGLGRAQRDGTTARLRELAARDRAQGSESRSEACEDDSAQSPRTTAVCPVAHAWDDPVDRGPRP